MAAAASFHDEDLPLDLTEETDSSSDRLSNFKKWLEQLQMIMSDMPPSNLAARRSGKLLSKLLYKWPKLTHWWCCAVVTFNILWRISFYCVKDFSPFFWFYLMFNIVICHVCANLMISERKLWCYCYFKCNAFHLAETKMYRFGTRITELLLKFIYSFIYWSIFKYSDCNLLWTFIF